MMPVATITAQGGHDRLHIGWMAHWNASFQGNALKQVIFDDPRFADRIIADISGLDVCPDEVASDLEALSQRLKPFFSPESLTEVGLAWSAPRLFLCLFDPKTRYACGPLTPKQVEMLTEFHSHADKTVVPVLPDVTALADQGLICVVAWLTKQDSAQSEILKFKFNPLIIEQIDYIDSRANFFETYLNRHSQV